MGLVGDDGCACLGLLSLPAKTSYDAQTSELTEVSAKIVFLDRMLAHYGPETKEARELPAQSRFRCSRSDVVGRPEELIPNWSRPPAPEVIYERIQGLSPKDDGATLDPGPGVEYADGPRTNALVKCTRKSYFGFHAVADGAGFLAYHYFHQLRPFSLPLTRL